MQRARPDLLSEASISDSRPTGFHTTLNHSSGFIRLLLSIFPGTKKRRVVNDPPFVFGDLLRPTGHMTIHDLIKDWL